MRVLSFVLAFGLLIAGATLADTADGGLPGIGTFAYSGAPITTAASQPVVVASRL